MMSAVVPARCTRTVSGAAHPRVTTHAMTKETTPSERNGARMTRPGFRPQSRAVTDADADTANLLQDPKSARYWASCTIATATTG